MAKPLVRAKTEYPHAAQNKEHIGKARDESLGENRSGPPPGLPGEKL